MKLRANIEIGRRAGLTWVCISFKKQTGTDRCDLYSCLPLIAPEAGFGALSKVQRAPST